ncbi:MAG: hypothetical protein J2P36_23170, partial [Ktedonobacteraceae bacterium]|nr:hypothetical protein [Ktedonobacteraceae bacterium]
WNVVLPRLRSMLTPGGYLALVHRSVVSQPWRADLEQILAQFSTGEGHPHGWLDTLVASQLFQKKGEQKTAPVPFVQSIDDFIEGLHSRSRFSKALMDAQSAAELDRQVRDLLLPLYQDGMISMQVVGRVVWGIPGEGE